MDEAIIIGIPDDDYEYEFMVLRIQDDGVFLWHSNHEDADSAYNMADAINGIVAHNLRIHHKKLKK